MNPFKRDIRAAMGGIRAEDALKARTRAFISTRTRTAGVFMRFGHVTLTVAASILLLLVTGAFAHGIYYTPDVYVDMDINPSVELVTNRFNRVIDAYAYNDDGQRALGEISLLNQTVWDAVSLFAGHTAEMNDGLISITVQAQDKAREDLFLTAIQGIMESIVLNNGTATHVDVFPVSRDLRTHAHNAGITPAKYLAIQALQTVDPTVTLEDCKHHSLSELNEQVRKHGDGEGKGGHHHGGGD